MSVSRISERYAKMLVSTADDQQKIDEIINDASVFEKALENRDLLLMYKSPLITTEKKTEITEQIFSGKVSDLFMNFLKVTLNKGRESYLSDIISSIQTQTDDIKNITRIHIITASEVSDEIIEEIKNTIKKTGATNDKLIATHEIDPSLIGGYRVTFDGNVYDASVKHQLNNLKKSFIPTFN